MPDYMIAQIQARLDAATPGPWHSQFAEIGYDRVETWQIQDGSSYLGESATATNAEFIAYAREDVPRLLDMLAVAEARLARAEECIEQVQTLAYNMRFDNHVRLWQTRLDGIAIKYDAAKEASDD